MSINPRVAMDFSVMKEIGIAEKKVKPVLKNLLKVYDKNWQLIEDENYRVLADAIFEYQEENMDNEMQKKKKQLVKSHEDSGPPRRKRLRQDDQLSPPLVRRQRDPNFNLTSREEGIGQYGQGMSGDEAVPPNMCMPDFSRDETEEPLMQLQLRRKRSAHAQSVSPHINFEDRGNGSLLAPTICRRNEREVPTAPFVVCLKESKTEPGIEPLPPKEKLLNSAQGNALIKLKTEPCSDGFQPSEVPIAVTHPRNPDRRRTQDPVQKDQNVSNGCHGVETLPSRDVAGENRDVVVETRDAVMENESLGGSGTLCKNGGDQELADVQRQLVPVLNLLHQTQGR